MEKEFIPYEQALALKELGFDEPCWCYFMGDIFNSSMFLKDYEYLDTMPQKYITYTLAPLYQQAFDWFLLNYGLWFRPDYYDENRNDFSGSIHKLGKFSALENIGEYKSAEEAKIACLNKLIEIIKK